MNFKKALVSVPLSVALLVPGYNVLADEHVEKPTVTNAAVDLRSDLDRLFSEHAYLAMTAMRKGANGEKDFNQVAEALNGNTKDLTAAISSVYGDEAGSKFNEMWSSHIGYFVDYVKATAGNDEGAKQKALENLQRYKNDFSAFISTATEGKLAEEQLAKGLQTHVDQLINGFNAFVEGDYEKAYMIQSDAMEHLYMTSKGLSSAIVSQNPDKFNNTKAVTKAADLRSNLNFLLSEHFALAQQAMQNGINGDPEFDANVKVLNQNTEELSAAIASVYGKEAGMKFKEMWSKHIGYFVDYVKATAATDDAAKQEALDNLNQYRMDFSKFISTATEGRVEADALAQGLQTHVDQLVGAFNSYNEGDYSNTWMKAREGYEHMFTPANLFSSAFVAQFPEMFTGMPEMPETGMGGMSQEKEIMWMLWALPILLFAAIPFVKRKEQSAE
ncbi:copper amine oxidase [Mesobacillus selenatarsenatis]|uniref:Copper amine oxidase n=1 Tax=Mesobacillus selenatarsenatis TaxID=388741 RepID=A0A846TKY8_9BACI|nr:copper amine oxidase [Mesobacillus selenatarsenatis]NKE07640.1 copper amine oxidase [Mesobacillus selenatarsenatis]